MKPIPLFLLVGGFLLSASPTAVLSDPSPMRLAELTPQQRAKLHKPKADSHTRPTHRPGRADSPGSDRPTSSAGESSGEGSRTGESSDNTTPPKRTDNPPPAAPPMPPGGKLPVTRGPVTAPQTKEQERTFDAFQQYKRSGYLDMNPLLRGTGSLKVGEDGKVSVDGRTTNRTLSEYQQSFRAMGDTMRKAPKYQGNTVYRGVTLNAEGVAALKKKFKDKGDWEDGGFMSTATSDSPGKWARSSQFADREIMVEVDLSKARGKHGGVGLDSGPMSAIVGGNYENEVLFPPGQRFKVVEMVEGADAVKQRLGIDPASAKAFKAKTYIKLVAEPYTDSDAQAFERKVDNLGKTEEPRFAPIAQPQRPH